MSTVLDIRKKNPGTLCYARTGSKIHLKQMHSRDPVCGVPFNKYCLAPDEAKLVAFQLCARCFPNLKGI